MKMYQVQRNRSQEITNIYHSTKQTESERRRKESWKNDLQSIIRRVLPNLRLVLAGSSTCGFALEGSDCDFTLIRSFSSHGYVSAVSVLDEIQRILKDASTTRLRTELISSAVVPILILEDRDRKLEGDISYDARNILYNSFLMHCYSNMDSRVMPLVITVKAWAKKANITNARYHKLSGFAVVLLVLHYLQHGCYPPVFPSIQTRYPRYFSANDPNSCAAWLEQEFTPPEISAYNSANSETLGVLLEGFFRYYATFNWRQVISVRNGGFVTLPRTKKWTNPHIRIEDPSDRINVTRAVYESYAFDQIKAAFTAAFQKLNRGGSVNALVS